MLGKVSPGTSSASVAQSRRPVNISDKPLGPSEEETGLHTLSFPLCFEGHLRSPGLEGQLLGQDTSEICCCATVTQSDSIFLFDQSCQYRAASLPGTEIWVILWAKSTDLPKSQDIPAAPGPSISALKRTNGQVDLWQSSRTLLLCTIFSHNLNSQLSVSKSWALRPQGLLYPWTCPRLELSGRSWRPSLQSSAIRLAEKSSVSDQH